MAQAPLSNSVNPVNTTDSSPPTQQQHHQQQQHPRQSSTNWLGRLSVLASVAATGYFLYRYYTQPQTYNESSSTATTAIRGGSGGGGIEDDEIEDETKQYKITPLNQEFDRIGSKKSTKGKLFSRTSGGNDSNTIDTENDPILQQRRFSSVLSNPHLNHGKTEYYFHLGIDSSNAVLMSQFESIKWVVIARSASDVKQIAYRLLREFPQFGPQNDQTQQWNDINNNNNNNNNSNNIRNDAEAFGLPKPLGDTGRFYMLRLGPVVIVSCGIGASSMSILLQEVLFLVFYLECFLLFFGVICFAFELFFF